MPVKSSGIDEYLKTLPADRQKAFSKLRQTILKNLPKGFKEIMGNGMICYVVPHEIYPKGYHVDPSMALPFISLSSQKNFISFHHMGLYGNPSLSKWFQEEYTRQVPTKLDMGKSCVRFKQPGNIPYKLIADLVLKIGVKDWIKAYEAALKR